MKNKNSIFCVVFILLITVVLYKPGIQGPFVFDDYANIVNNQKLKINEFSLAVIINAITSTTNGVFGRPLSMLTFAANTYWDRNLITPFPLANTYKMTNIAIHLCNVIAVYIFLTKLVVSLKSGVEGVGASYRRWLPVLVCAAWAVHPFNVTAVLYVVQRMTSLSTLFILLGMIFYLTGRQMLTCAPIYGKAIMLGAMIVFAPLSFLCKEIGVLMPVYFYIIEIFCKSKNEIVANKGFIKKYFLIFLWMPIALASVYFLSRGEWLLAGYERRHFTLEQRLLTEARVVCFYLVQTVFPNIQNMGMFHDDIRPSLGLFDPVETLTSIATLFLLMVLIIKIRTKQPLISFGISFFIIGHSLESTIIPLELVHEHRNYLPGLGMLIVMISLLISTEIYAGLKRARNLSVAILIIIFSAVTYSRAIEWSNPKSLWEMEAARHPDSIRSQLALGDYYAGAVSFTPEAQERNFIGAMSAYKKALSIDANSVIANFGILKVHSAHQKLIESKYLEGLKKGLTQEPLPANTNSYLLDMLHCLGKNLCAVNAQQLGELIAVTLENPRARPADRALLYEVQAIYKFQVTQEYQLALQAIDAALELGANADIKLWRVNVYVRMNDFARARQELQELRQLDANLHLKSELSELEDLLGRQPK